VEVEGGDGVEEGAAGNEEGLDYHRSVLVHISIWNGNDGKYMGYWELVVHSQIISKLNNPYRTARYLDDREDK